MVVIPKLAYKFNLGKKTLNNYHFMANYGSFVKFTYRKNTKSPLGGKNWNFENVFGTLHKTL